MSEYKITLPASAIISIFNTASVTFHNEFFDWAFDNYRDNNYPLFSESESDKRPNAILYKEWLLKKWTSTFNIEDDELVKLDNYLTELLSTDELE